MFNMLNTIPLLSVQLILQGFEKSQPLKYCSIILNTYMLLHFVTYVLLILQKGTVPQYVRHSNPPVLLRNILDYFRIIYIFAVIQTFRNHLPVLIF